MDARRTPQRIVNAHPPDQRAQVRVDLRPTSKGAGFPTPVMAKAGPMPTHQGLRSDESDGPEHRWKPSIQQDQEQAIPICELDATPHPALQHNAGPDGVREPRPHHSSGIDVPMKRQASLGCVGTTDCAITRHYSLASSSAKTAEAD